jgi:hypothetical protein
MKSSIEITNHVVEPKFPALYQSVNSELVVLFTAINDGFTIVPNDLKSIGNSANWHDCTNTDKWKRLPEGTKVTLIQEGAV